MSLTICGQDAAKPNFVIFIADDVSWNDLGCYGNQSVQTPNIDKLSTHAIKFNNAYLTASSCSPSRNSIITGRYPHNTGAAELHTEPPLEMVSFPELLRNQGYYSVQAGKFHLGKYAERGFDKIYRERSEVGDGGELKWVQSLKERPIDKPFFMWFAAFDAHRDWGPNQFSGKHQPETVAPPFYLADADATKKDLAQYYDEIFRFDHFIGQVVEQLSAQNALQNTVIIIMADNGRPFPHSKTRVNDRGMKTPFLVYWPQMIGQQKTSNSLISAIDIAPTLLSLAGAEVPASMQGVSFEKLLKDPSLPFRNQVYAEHNWHDYEAHERMVRNKDFMYIRNARPMKPQLGPADAVGSPSFRDLREVRATESLTAIQADIFATPRPVEELYHLASDSLQLHNIAADPTYQVHLEAMRKLLETWMEETGDDTPSTLTQDWYTHEPGYIKTKYHGIRGTMPGADRNAIKTNQKGPF